MGGNMKFFYPAIGFLLSVLFHTHVAAVVTDTFSCSLELVDERGRVGENQIVQLTAIRTPFIDDNWLEGAVGWKASLTTQLSDPATETTASINLDYEIFRSADHTVAAQWLCLSYDIHLPNSASGSACGRPGAEFPFDPTTLNPETGISPNGLPIFRAEDLAEEQIVQIGSQKWRAFRFRCTHLGTTETIENS
jgi:hypothetical protein